MANNAGGRRPPLSALHFGGVPERERSGRKRKWLSPLYLYIIIRRSVPGIPNGVWALPYSYKRVCLKVSFLSALLMAALSSLTVRVYVLHLCHCSAPMTEEGDLPASSSSPAEESLAITSAVARGDGGGGGGGSIMLSRPCLHCRQARVSKVPQTFLSYGLSRQHAAHRGGRS